MAPVRVQLKRAKGWRMPPVTVSVTRPGKWGNPFVVGEFTAETAVEAFRTWIEGEDLTPLRGKNLACWCKLGAACHADVLLELANQPLTVNNGGGE